MLSHDNQMTFQNADTLHQGYLFFEERLNKSLQKNDIAQVKRLVQEVDPSQPLHPFLHQWYLYALSYLAGLDGQNLAEAVRLLEDVHHQKELAPRLRGRVLNALGIVYEMNEQWDRALRFYHECLDFYEAESNYLWLAITRRNLAIVYWKAADYQGALDSAGKSIEILSQGDGDGEWLGELGAAWNTFGFSYLKQGSLPQAQAALEKSLAICTQCEDRFHEGIVLNNLAQVYRRLGKNEKAEAYYLRARELTRETDNLRETAEAIYGLALLKKQIAAPLAETQLLLDEALALAKATNNHEIMTDILLTGADLQEQQGNLNGALAITRQAVTAVESLRANIVLPDDRIRMTASRVTAYEQLVSRLCQQGAYEEAFRYAEMSKSRTLIELLAGRPLRRPERVPADWLSQGSGLRQRLHALYQASDASVMQIAALEAELHHLRERIRWQDAEFSSFQTVDPLTLKQVQARLPSQSVLLEYFTIGDLILAFVVTPQHIRYVPLPLKVSQLKRAFKPLGDDRFASLHHLTRGVDYRLRKPWILGKLHQMLIEPLGQEVQEAHLLCLVPHGLLHYIPFHALYQVSPLGNRYLLGDDTDARQIVYAPSATALLDYCQSKPLSQQTGCFALGYNNQTLTQAEAEADTVARLMDGDSHTAKRATRATLMEEAQHYRYIHLSCHGSFNRTWPMASSLTLADQTLDVADILQHLQLNAELVCLSACETGRSHILGGDELIGLTRAFLYAGTPSIMVSQWVVDDLSTRLFMERFYDALRQNEAQTPTLAKAKALKQAQNYLRTLTLEQLRDALKTIGLSLAEIERYLEDLAASVALDPVDRLAASDCLFAHPYYWAGFFLVGERLGPATTAKAGSQAAS